VTRQAAERAGVRTIDATIRADNAGGLAFYGSLGFREYARRATVPLSDGTLVDRVCKRLDLS
jgi:ribosomal protein S18 acetylase RimI-like enzyme